MDTKIIYFEQSQFLEYLHTPTCAQVYISFLESSVLQTNIGNGQGTNNSLGFSLANNTLTVFVISELFCLLR